MVALGGNDREISAFSLPRRRGNLVGFRTQLSIKELLERMKLRWCIFPAFILRRGGVNKMRGSERAYPHRNGPTTRLHERQVVNSKAGRAAKRGRHYAVLGRPD